MYYDLYFLTQNVWQYQMDFVYLPRESGKITNLRSSPLSFVNLKLKTAPPDFVNLKSGIGCA